MVDSIDLHLTREQAESLARIFALMEINIRVNPEIYSQKAKDLHFIFEALDYQIHEVAKWCDRKECSYWVKKQKKEEQKIHD